MSYRTAEDYWIGNKNYIKVESRWHEVIDLPPVDWCGRVIDLYHYLGDVVMRFPDAQLDYEYDYYSNTKLIFSGATEPVANDKIIAALDKQVEKKKQEAAAIKKKKIEQERKRYERLAKKYGPKS